MSKTIKRWQLFKYAGNKLTPLPTLFKTRILAEVARSKYSERQRRTIEIGAILIDLKPAAISRTMTPRQLAAKIRGLRARLPITAAFERALNNRGSWSSENVWYKTQKQHLLGWLADYSGPGYYGRTNWKRSAKFVYNHIVCPPMVLWLGEALGIPKTTAVAAMRAGLSAKAHLPSKCAAVRGVIPWEMIESLLHGKRM